MAAEKVRWLTRKDGTRVLQEYAYYGWQDVEEITEAEENQRTVEEKERQEFENERLKAAFKGKTYTVR